MSGLNYDNQNSKPIIDNSLDPAQIKIHTVFYPQNKSIIDNKIAPAE